MHSVYIFIHQNGSSNALAYTLNNNYTVSRKKVTPLDIVPQ